VQIKVKANSVGEGMANILVADDDCAVRMVIETVLARTGQRVMTEENGAEAIPILKAETVDIAIVDLMVPEVDGIETLSVLERL